jgi:hypothetical protein
MGAAVTISPTTSIRLVWPFIVLGRKYKYDVSGWVAARLGLTARQLEDPETRVPQHLVARLLDEAIERSGQRDIGLLAALFVDSANYGIGEYVARTRPTLRAAMESTGRYLPLLGDGAGHAIERHGKRVIVRFWFSAELAIHEAAYEFALAVGVLCARRITGIADLAPISVHFSAPRAAVPVSSALRGRRHASRPVGEVSGDAPFRRGTGARRPARASGERHARKLAAK